MDPTSRYISATRIAQEQEQAATDLYVESTDIPGLLPSAAGRESDFAVSDNPMAGSGGGSSLPFQAKQASNTSVEISAGTVDGVAFSTSTLSSITSTTKVYLDITVNASGVVTAVTADEASSVPADTSTRAYVLLADVTVTESVISDIQNYLSGSLGHAYGGGTEHILWRV